MIELKPHTAIMLYLSLMLGGLFIIWFLSFLMKKGRKVDLEKEKVHLCEYCQFAYINDKGVDISKCPQCHSFNKH